MPEIVNLRVFVSDAGCHGNPLPIVVGSERYSDDQCTELTRAFGTNEAVFLDEIDTGRLRIFMPTGRVAFAGHPLIGIGWFLRAMGSQLTAIMTDAGPVAFTADSRHCTISTEPGRGRPWNLLRMPTPADVLEASSEGGGRHDYAWAWHDEGAGTVRSRAFTSSSGNAEDEATGSAAIELCAQLNCELMITQGRGSMIHVKPSGKHVELTGAVITARPASRTYS